ncbi:cell division protein FtsA [Leptospira sp. GIMC2001]|uniref:cell division protein FtsA n=1 Tax=Leptospira sp. GIMC2001 TaxID=1513297 RepID=UPI00234ADA7E|nr:cell division protein FtsA [Leptospira sp. GIMC2001]WCL47941.1 cell division FtsA domain-containing protein [Leptospira sp. GIMC2001]
MIYDQYLAIDYGSKFIKGILFKNVLGTTTAIRLETLPIVHLADEEGDEYEYNIIRFIQSFFPEESKFLTNLSLDRLFIRDLVIPLTTEKAVREVIPFEVENKLPFPSETMEVLGVLARMDSENSFVVTFNVKHEELSRVMSPFNRGDARVACLSVDSLALSSLFHKLDKNTLDQSYLGQIDIGSQLSVFNAVHNGKLYHTRSIHLGSQNLTEMLAEELSIDDEDAEDFKILLSPFLFEGSDEFPESLEYYKKKYKITNSIWKSIRSKTEIFGKKIVSEIEKSIFSLIDTERPQTIYISGGGSKLAGLGRFISSHLEIPIKEYDFLDIQDPSYIQALATGNHYQQKSSDQIDFLTTDFAKRLNKNSFKIGNFLPHLILAGISVFLLAAVFVFGIIIDKRKISQNRQILVEKYRSGFGEEPSDPELVIQSAISKLKAEQKKTEIFRLFLNKESMLDILTETSEFFPDKESLPFILENFTFEGSEVSIQGKVNEYPDIGVIESGLAKSSKFKNVKVMNKRLISGVTKFKVSFKLKMEIVSPDSE